MTEPVPVCIDPLPPVVPEDLVPEDPWDSILPIEDPGALALVGSVLARVLDSTIYMDIEPIERSLFQSSSTSVDPATWDRALTANPDLLYEILASDSYVYMQYKDGLALGISCQQAACHEFTPHLDIGPNGAHLSTVGATRA